MSDELADAAHVIIKKYYYEKNAFVLGLAERGIKDQRDIEIAYLALPGWEDKVDDYRKSLLTNFVGNASIASLFTSSWADRDHLLRHAQRILVVWLLESFVLGGSRVFLVDLLDFDFDYLSLYVFHKSLFLCRDGVSDDLDKRYRNAFSSALRDMFVASPGRQGKIKSKIDLKMEYMGIRGELANFIETDFVAEFGMDAEWDRGLYRITSPKPFQAMYNNLNHFLSCVRLNIREIESQKVLHGLPKVIALHFPDVKILEDNPGEYRVVVDEGDVAGGRLKSVWGELWPLYENAIGNKDQATDDIVDEDNSSYDVIDINQREFLAMFRGKMSGFAEVAELILAAKYGMKKSAVHRDVGEKAEITQVKIANIDKLRDWRLVEEWLSVSKFMVAIRNMKFPRDYLVGTSQAKSCGLSDDLLLKIARFEPKVKPDLGPSHRSLVQLWRKTAGSRKKEEPQSGRKKKPLKGKPKR